MPTGQKTNDQSINPCKIDQYIDYYLLSPLSEDLSLQVEVQYCGNGEMVEVAGSFNGWHHPVRLDPQPSSSIKDHFGSRFFNILSSFNYCIHDQL